MNYLKYITDHPGIASYAAFIAILFVLIICRKWYVLDKRNLFRQKLFWVSVGVPFVSFIYFGLFAWWGKTPVLSAHGYARFYEISKFPLLLLASSVPLASIVNNIHRTIQTETQINTSETKNAVDRYLAHEKNFIEKTKEILAFKLTSARDSDGKLTEFKHNDSKFVLFTSDEVKISNPYLLYNKIYNNATMETSSNFDPNTELLSNIKNHLSAIDNTLSFKHPIPNDNPASYMIRLNRLSFNIASLLDLICANSISHVYCLVKHGRYELKTFTPEEQILADTLEATYHLSRKLVRLIYNEELPNFNNIYNYLYVGNLRFDLRQKATFLQPFSSQDWTDYVTESLSLLPHTVGDNLAAEV
ncbi:MULTISPECIES: hypothetical protein [unclassified Enterobacter cloacae complex]|uniref:hypothetical protein n=2 Tax=Enterobacter cloacae complex TaxID=354276 RepID=UPI0018725FCA|nr:MULTISPECIES: hypothetical protein [unclassified Enterobacter cloacae complex]MBE4810273.1 hypothetical protein [Enterobacter cloacae complex sp. P44RS]MBE4836049.1 hypothetical protein [Enterobacter cloacae complex sp. P46RS]MBE4840050.1 hypothetical protein [Enterobacter cloacae complex sp. P42C]